MTPNCHEQKCDRSPEFEVFWPGKVPPPRYCFEHTQVARSILWTLGCDVEVRAIIVRDEAAV